MSNTESEAEGLGTRLLTWAMIAGAAMLMLEATLEPAQPVTKTAAVQTVSVASVARHERLAQN